MNKVERREHNLLKGVVDMHLHGAPDLVPRKLDEIALAERAKAAGMKAILLKCHYALTADRAWLISKIVKGIKVFGSLALNLPVTGGFNPQAVLIAVGFGAKEIWMPTISAVNHIKYEGKDPKEGISVLSKTGEVSESVVEILNIIAEANIILGTGHISPLESETLIKTARSLGVRKILITHPEWKPTSMPIDLQVELAKEGAIMEHCFYATTGLGGKLSPREIAVQIKKVGAKHCIMATDLGQRANQNPVSGMETYIKGMMAQGISPEEIDLMTKKNPAELLGLP